MRSAAPIEGLVSRAKELGMTALALTDLGNLFGSLRFYKECRFAGITPIIGSEFFLAPESRHVKNTELGGRYDRIVLLAMDSRGYQNLSTLSSISYTEGFYYRPRIDDELLQSHSAGLVCLSGSISGDIPRLIINNRVEEAEERARFYQGLFGDRFYLSVQHHGIPEEAIVASALAEVSRKLGITRVVTNDVYYVEKADANAQDILTCIGGGKRKSELNRFRFSSPEFYLKSPGEMAALFPDEPELVSNTVALASRCVLEIEEAKPQLPEYHIPEGFADAPDYLRHVTHKGLVRRYGIVTDEICERANYELDIIVSMSFTGYFLIVWDFVRFAHENDIPVGPGRGSGAGSIVAYALEITDIDPLKYGLLFERFLNPDRVSMPDFDIDFCFERRGEVIDYVTRKYGVERVGQIITFGTLKARAVLRDVARVLELSYDEADKIAKMVPADPKMTLEKALSDVPELAAVASRGGAYTELIKTARRLEGLSRHASTHAAGVVIGRENLTKYVPLYRDPKTGAVTTQFGMDQLEECGLIKMDFLGLKTLTLIKNTESLIRESNPDFDINKVSEHDEATFRLLGAGKSVCVFQFESEGMQQILKKARPTRIEDLIALNALYRPGPMENIDQFVESKHGRMPVSYPHPSLKDILEETYGVIIYQEQVMEIVQVIAGFSLGQADILRRAMGKKKQQEMERMKVDYLAGAAAKGIDRATAESIFVLLEPFAGYGFNKSHAAAYSVLAYKTAYLKANYPAHFMAANLTNEMQNTDKFAEYLNECRNMGISVRPPDINTSGRQFTVVHGTIVFGLLGIKNVGTSAVDTIIEKRQTAGPFQSFADFLERIDMRSVNRKTVETLIDAGVFDSFDQNRRRLALLLPRLWEVAHAKKESRKYGQVSLFEDCEEEEFVPPGVDESVADHPLQQRLARERELLGAYFTGHPLDDHRRMWLAATTVDLGRLGESSRERECALVALVVTKRTTVTKGGDPITFALVEDYRGSIELVLAGETQQKFGEALEVGRIVGVIGVINERGGKLRIRVDAVREPDDMDEHDKGIVHIRLANGTDMSEQELFALRGFLFENGGTCPLYIHLGSNGSESVIRAGDQLCVSSKSGSLDRIQMHPLVAEVWTDIPGEERAHKGAP